MGDLFSRRPVSAHVKDLLHGLADAVQNALRRAPGDLADVVGKGADGAPTRRIDAIAERAAFEYLDTALPEGRSVLSEEAGRVDRGGEWTIVLDPVDGTHNAIRGIPAYAVSAALCKRAPQGKVERLVEVRAGLVRDLVSGITYYAESGKGATRDAIPIRVTKPFAPRDTVFDVYLGEKAHPKASEVAGRARRVRNLGAASLDLCLVACGAADLYYMHSAEAGHELRAMDIAAGVLIVREAGGGVVDLAGRPLDMPLDIGPRTNLIAYGDEQILEMLL